VGALHKPRGAALHSARYTQGVAAAAARLGAAFCYRTAVSGVEAEGDGWRVATARGEVRARQVVVALNAWAGDVFPALAPLLTPVRGHILVTEPVAARLRPWSANAGYEYGQQLPDGRLLIGGQRLSRADRDEGYPPAPGRNAPPVEPAVVAALEAVLPQIVPAAAGAVTERAWSGVMDFSPDHHPLAGAWPGRPGLWVLVGFSGHGMPYSQVLPYALAAQMAGGDGPTIPSAFAPGRFLE
jgi:glycine/D-amino acid oxidase-like deaminating enzyme